MNGWNRRCEGSIRECATTFAALFPFVFLWPALTKNAEHIAAMEHQDASRIAARCCSSSARIRLRCVVEFIGLVQNAIFEEEEAGKKGAQNNCEMNWGMKGKKKKQLNWSIQNSGSNDQTVQYSRGNSIWESKGRIDQRWRNGMHELD